MVIFTNKDATIDLETFIYFNDEKNLDGIGYSVVVYSPGPNTILFTVPGEPIYIGTTKPNELQTITGSIVPDFGMCKWLKFKISDWEAYENQIPNLREHIQPLLSKPSSWILYTTTQDFCTNISLIVIYNSKNTEKFLPVTKNFQVFVEQSNSLNITNLKQKLVQFANPSGEKSKNKLYQISKLINDSPITLNCVLKRENEMREIKIIIAKYKKLISKTETQSFFNLYTPTQKLNV